VGRFGGALTILGVAVRRRPEGVIEVLRVLIVGIGALSIAPVFAQQTLYRCAEKGRTVISNTPCKAGDGAAVAAPSAQRPVLSASGSAQDYTSPYGEWRGQVQYQASLKGQQISEAHAVVPLVIRIDSLGKVVGSSPENGCKLLGVAKPSPFGPTMLDLDVTFSNCAYARYNRRFSGRIYVNGVARVGDYSLSTADIGVGYHYQFDMKGSLRR
jgi:hypothetical protein